MPAEVTYASVYALFTKQSVCFIYWCRKKAQKCVIDTVAFAILNRAIFT